MLSSFTARLPPNLTGFIDRIAGAVRETGTGFVLWTVAIAFGLGATVLATLSPSGPLPHPFFFEKHPVAFIAVLTALVAAIALGVAALRRRKETRELLPIYADTVRLGAPLSMLPLVLVLREPLEGARPEVVLAIAALAGVLTVYAAYFAVSERESGSGRFVRWAAVTALALLMLAYAVAACRITIANHINMNTGRSDLGYYLSVFRQSSQGKLLGCSLCGGGSHLTGHFDPILVLLSPLFLLYPFAETLLVLQTVWLTAGAIPVYLLARKHVRHRGAATALAATYLAYPALHGVNFFDFHSIALSIPLFIWLLYCMEQGYRVSYYVTLALLLLVREDVPIALVCVGLYAIFSRAPERARMGWITILVSVAYFITVKAAFMGRVDPLNTAAGAKGGYAYYYEAMIPKGYSTSALVGTLLTNPIFVLSHVFTDEKVDFILKLLVPLLFLPIVARGRMLLTYGAALTLLASRQYLFSIHFQYASLLVPFVFVLAVSALGRIRSGELLPIAGLSGPRLARALSFGMLMTTVICSWKFGALVENASFQGGFRPLQREINPDNRALAAWLKTIARSLPRGARVAGNSRLITHLGPVTSLDLLENRAKADYVVANLASRPLGPRIEQEAAAGELTLLAGHDHFRLYKAHYKTAAAPSKLVEPTEQ